MFTTVELKLLTLCNFFYKVDMKKAPSGVFFFTSITLINNSMKTLKQVEAIDCICEQKYQDLEITEAEYQGRKLN